jgi:hypothetical protein
MTQISYTTDPNEVNHVRYDYTVDKIFLNFPSKQKKLTFVNGTASERTIVAGTLVGITTADQTIAQPVKSDATDGSEIPFGLVLYDTVIAAGAAEEVEALVGWNGSIYEDKITLEKAGDTLDTVITNLGQSVRNALLNSNARIDIEPAALNMSGFKNDQV